MMVFKSDKVEDGVADGVKGSVRLQVVSRRGVLSRRDVGVAPFRHALQVVD